jgi:3-deoxy-D-manno-octulosonic-acid transferase
VNNPSSPARQRVWTPLYHLLIYPAFVNAMRLTALWSDKVRRALRGRNDWRAHAWSIRPARPEEFSVHFHASSVGEFEQAKPIIEALRSDGHPYRITASFFSPSGYEQQGSYAELDGACYLPYDRQGEMSVFMNRLSPDLIIIIRYDLWLEFLRQARLRSIPVVLVCGVLHADSSRLRFPLRSFFEELYQQLTLIHAVTDDDRRGFHRLAPEVPVEVTGDTRYDRVIARARAAADVSVFAGGGVAGRDVVVAGSTWPDDEELLKPLHGRKNLLLVIVPHEPSPEHVASLVERFPGARPLSALMHSGMDASVTTVIVDSTGSLAALYRIGTIAYVGGGFGDGVHSVLEPASYGIPVISGPRIERSRDAVAMEHEKVLSVVKTADELQALTERLLADRELLGTAGAAAQRFVDERTGATGRILDSLYTRGMLPGSGVAHETTEGREAGEA